MSHTVWTVGHSNRSADAFAALLKAHDIRLVADVRRFPVSKRHPHFSRELLEPMLASGGVRYSWFPDLGGRRSARKDSVNTGWRVVAFRGYADYMETAEFRDAFQQLLDASGASPTAIMCAEALWWQCHRRLLADRLLALGHTVLHIQSAASAAPHKLVSPAQLRNGQLSYAAEQPELGLDPS